MALGVSFALGKGFTAKFCYGAALGGILGFTAGKMLEYNPESKFAKHLKRFGNELSADSDLSLDFYEKEKNYSSPRTNYPDYETSKRDFCKVHNHNYDNFDNYYNNNSGFRPESNKSSPDYYKESPREKLSFKEKSNTFKNNYDTDNYTSNYDLENYTKNYD